MSQRELTEAENIIQTIIEKTPEPISVPQVYAEEVLKFFDLYKDHKGIVRAGGANLGGPQLIGIMMPGPTLLESLLKNR